MNSKKPLRIGELFRLPNSNSVENNRLLKFSLRLLLFLLILNFVPESSAKFIAVLSFAYFTLRPFSHGEIGLFILVNILYFFMDALAIQNQFFAFRCTQVWGMPYYEMLVWGTYFLMSLRFMSHQLLPKSYPLFFLSFVCFLVAFNSAPSAEFRSVFCLIILLVSLAFSLNRQTVTVILLFLLMGLSVELLGVYNGYWYYPNEAANYIPLWSYLVWVASGFYLIHFVGFLNHLIYSKGYSYELSTEKIK